MSKKQVDIVANQELNKYMDITEKTLDDITDMDCKIIGKRVSDLCEVAS